MADVLIYSEVRKQNGNKYTATNSYCEAVNV